MAYSRNTWQTGENITAAKLNNIESGIVDVEKLVEDNSASTAESISKITDTVDSFNSSARIEITCNNDGYYDAAGNLHDPTSAVEKYSDMLDVAPGESFDVRIYNPEQVAYSVMFFVSCFGSEGNHVERLTLLSKKTSDETVSFTVPENVKKIAISYRTYNSFVFDMYVNSHVTEIKNQKYKEYNIHKKAFVRGINHRGYNNLAPENTLSAFFLSYKYGFDAVETDVQLTSDDELICIHDDTVDRTTDGTGNVKELTLEQIRALDAGSWFSSKYAGEKVPTFEEVLTLCKNLGLHLYAELKVNGSMSQEQTQKIVDCVKQNGMIKNVTFISFSLTALKYVADYVPTARLGLLGTAVSNSIINDAKTLQTGQNEVFIDTTKDSGYKDYIADLAAADIGVEIWTLDSEADILEIDNYVSGVTSNKLDAGKIILEKEVNDNESN